MFPSLATASRTDVFLTNLPWLHHEHAFLHIKSVKSKLGLNSVLEEISMQITLAQSHIKITKRETAKHIRTSEKRFRCLAFH